MIDSSPTISFEFLFENSARCAKVSQQSLMRSLGKTIELKSHQDN
jgi:hypothetical protein